MPNNNSEDEDAFLREVARKAPANYRRVDFPAILARLVEWSQAPHRQLYKQAPGAQPTVAYAMGASKYALWKAYPRTEDGAKVEVITRLLHRLHKSDITLLLDSLATIAPTVAVSATGVLMMPMYLLAKEDVLAPFLELLSAARESVVRVRPTAG